MWVDCNDGIPVKDGAYLVMTIWSEKKPLDYTVDAGWNTSWGDDGLSNQFALNDGYVVYWLDAPEPPEITEEMVNEYCERRK